MEEGDPPVDREAVFLALFDASYGKILAYATRRLGPSAAEEAVADVFITAWTSLDAVRSDPLLWLYGIVRGAVANHRRRLQRSARLGDAAHLPAATALLREIYELADAVRSDPEKPVVPRKDRGDRGGSGGHGAGRVATVAAAVVVAGGTSGVVLFLTRPAVPERTTTAWLASRPLATDARSVAREPAATASPWQLASHIVPTGWKLGTPGPGPGAVTCPIAAVCYVTGGTTAAGPVRPTAPGGLYVSTNGASSWSVLALPRGFTFASELACASALTAAAGGMVDGAAVFAETQDGGHRWTVTTTGAASALVDLTCRSADRCTALSSPAPAAPATTGGLPAPVPAAPDEHFVRSTDGGATWTVTPLPAKVTFGALACATATRCVVLGPPAATTGAAPGGIALWTDGGGQRWHRGTLPAGVWIGAPSNLACSGPVRCMAVATVAAHDPSACTTAGRDEAPGTAPAPTAPSCATAATTSVSTALTAADGGAAWRTAPLPVSLAQPHLDAVACAGPLTCWAAGTAAVPASGTPGSSVMAGTTNGGATWAVASVTVPATAPGDQGDDTSTAVGSVSCPRRFRQLPVDVGVRGARGRGPGGGVRAGVPDGRRTVSRGSASTGRGHGTRGGTMGTSTSWMARAACRDLPPETFFPEDGGGVEVARRICARCPVREDCLEYALSRHIAHGVWGGTSERGRQRLQAARRAAAEAQPAI